MSRLPDAPPDGEVADRVRSRRPGGVLRPIDLVLLHSPQVAAGWNTFVGTLRGGTDLPAHLRELAILRIGVLNGAEYEWDSHVADAMAAGITPAQLEALRQHHPAPEAFDRVEGLVLDLTDTMTREITVPETLFEQLHTELGDQQMVDLVVTVAAYNMVSRFVVAVDVQVPGGES